MSLADTAARYRTDFLRGYGHRMSDEHRHALSAIIHCRTEHYGQLRWRCGECEQTLHLYRSCGHRSCPRCQNQDNEQWLVRQQQKLLPVDYFMVTFTLPAELRGIAWQNQRVLYQSLFDAAVSTCRDFARNDKHLRGKIGQSAVLHTQTRRLDYHPHVHVIIPGGAIDSKRRCWRRKPGQFLFAHKALASVFRARMLKAISTAGLALGERKLPKQWVVDCRKIGSGLPALKYLSRYLYRGVVSEKQLCNDDGEKVTFSYQEGGTGKRCTRTLEGPDFLWLLIQHVLPKGFRRVRDYGFLHGNARRTRILVQWCLKVHTPALPAGPRTAGMLCRQCGTTMQCLGLMTPARLGYG